MALALARTGESARAESIAEELSRRFPKDTLVNTFSLPDIRAPVEISRGNASRAIELLQVTSPFELGDGCLLSIYQRGQAWLLARNGNEAAAEFQKFLLHPRDNSQLPVRRAGAPRLGSCLRSVWRYAQESDRVSGFPDPTGKTPIPMFPFFLQRSPNTRS